LGTIMGSNKSDAAMQGGVGYWVLSSFGAIHEESRFRAKFVDPVDAKVVEITTSNVGFTRSFHLYSIF
jgi:hypothetical protein